MGYARPYIDTVASDLGYVPIGDDSAGSYVAPVAPAAMATARGSLELSESGSQLARTGTLWDVTNFTFRGFFRGGSRFFQDAVRVLWSFGTNGSLTTAGFTITYSDQGNVDFQIGIVNSGAGTTMYDNADSSKAYAPLGSSRVIYLVKNGVNGTFWHGPADGSSALVQGGTLNLGSPTLSEFRVGNSGFGPQYRPRDQQEALVVWNQRQLTLLEMEDDRLSVWPRVRTSDVWAFYPLRQASDIGADVWGNARDLTLTGTARIEEHIAALQGTAGATATAASSAATGTPVVTGTAGALATAATVAGSGPGAVDEAVTGTAAVVADAATVAGAGTPVVAGSSSTIADAASAAAAGTPVVAGTAGAIADAATVFGQSELVTGSVAVVADAATVAASGSPVVEGYAGALADEAVAHADGSPVVAGGLQALAGGPLGALEGAPVVAGAVGALASAASASGSGPGATVDPLDPVTGEAAVVAQAATVAALGAPVAAGAGAIAAGAAAALGAGAVVGAGVAGVLASAASASSSGTPVVSGSVPAQAGAATVAISGQPIGLGTVAASAEAASVAISGSPVITGSGAVAASSAGLFGTDSTTTGEAHIVAGAAYVRGHGPGITTNPKTRIRVRVREPGPPRQARVAGASRCLASLDQPTTPIQVPERVPFRVHTEIRPAIRVTVAE